MQQHRSHPRRNYAASLSWILTCVTLALPLILLAQESDEVPVEAPLVTREPNQENKKEEAQDPNFPVPKELIPAMEFWKKVYLEVTSREGYLHDSENMLPIFAKLSIPENLTPKRQVRWLKEEKEKVKQKLTECAQKKMNDLCDQLPPEWTSQDILDSRHDIRFQLGQKDRFHAGVVRSGRYLDHIKVALREEGVPEDIAYLPHVESSFDYLAYSKVGAAGIWQFMRSTGKSYLKINYSVDERRDPLVSTHAAARLLKNNYRLLGTWPLALTAYNHGPNGLLKITRKMGTTDIGQIADNYRRGRFGFASRNFYAQFLVARDISKNLPKYMPDVKIEPTLAVKSIIIPKEVAMSKVIQTLNISTEELTRLNPALRPPVWNGEKRIPKNYALRLPANKDPQILVASAFNNNAEVIDSQKVLEGAGVRSVEPETPSDLAQGAKGEEVLPLPVPSAVMTVATAETTPAPPAVNQTPAPVTETPAVPPTPTVAMGDKQKREATPPKEPAPKEVAAKDASEEEVDEEELGDAPITLQENKELAFLKDPTSRTKVLLLAGERKVEQETQVSLSAEPDESLYVYSEWAGVSVNAIRKANKMSRNATLRSGQTIWIPLAQNMTPTDFQNARLEHHKGIEEDFFSNFIVVDAKTHRIRRGQQLWWLSTQRYNVPVWLLVRLNPEFDFETFLPGKTLKIPVVRPVKQR